MRICFIGDSFVNGTGDDDCLGWAGRLGAGARPGGAPHVVSAVLCTLSGIEMGLETMASPYRAGGVDELELRLRPLSRRAPPHRPAAARRRR